MAKQASKRTDMIMKRRFGEHLKKMRELKNMKLRELADVSGLDNSYISKVEQGKVNVTLITITELAKGLGVHPAELLEYDFE